MCADVQQLTGMLRSGQCGAIGAMRTALTSAQREACVCVRVWNNSWRVVGETHPLIVFQQNAALLPDECA